MSMNPPRHYQYHPYVWNAYSFPIPTPPSRAVQEAKQIPGMFPQENTNFIQTRSILLEILSIVKDIQSNLQADMVCKH